MPYANGATSLQLALVSVVAVVATMILALCNELWSGFPRVLFAVMPTMVLVHGGLNALVVAPCFYLAIAYDQNRDGDGERAR